MLRSPWVVARLRMSSQCCSNAGTLNFPVTYRTVVCCVAGRGVVACATLTPMAIVSATSNVAMMYFMYPPSGCCFRPATNCWLAPGRATCGCPTPERRGYVVSGHLLSIQFLATYGCSHRLKTVGHDRRFILLGLLLPLYAVGI